MGDDPRQAHDFNEAGTSSCAESKMDREALAQAIPESEGTTPKPRHLLMDLESTRNYRKL